LGGGTDATRRYGSIPFWLWNPTKGETTPFINVKVIEGVFDGEQKHEIIKKLTDAMVAIEGENMRPVTWCVVEEIGSGDWGIAGNPLSTQDVQALAAGR